jgi:hypothetical protein
MFDRIRRFLSGATSSVKAPKPERPSFRPQLEELGPRILPAVLTVMNANDAGVGSLREAVTDAARDGTMRRAGSISGGMR